MAHQTNHALTVRVCSAKPNAAHIAIWINKQSNHMMNTIKTLALALIVAAVGTYAQ